MNHISFVFTINMWMKVFITVIITIKLRCGLIVLLVYRTVKKCNVHNI